MRFRAIFAPTTSWWWKWTPPGPIERVSGLADVVEERREAQGPVRAGLLDDGDGVGKDVLVPLDRVLLEGERRKLGKELARRAPC